MNCRGYAHGVFCCFEWTSRADHGISITDDNAKKVKDPILPSAMVTHINSNPSKRDICKKCAEIVKRLVSAPVSTPATTLSNNYDRFVDDTSLTREVLKSTWEHDFN